MTGSRFVDGLVELDARETRARLTAALAAVRAHPHYAEGRRSHMLRHAVRTVEADLLRAAHEAVRRLDAALREADRPPTPSQLDDETLPDFIRAMLRASMEREAANGGRP